MNADELRIGNYVKYDGEKWTVTSILRDGFVEIYRFGIHKKINIIELLEITLTEEWLFKFSFRTEENYCFELDNISINTKRELLWIHTKCKNNIELNLPEYVHQLQNLYFTLTNTELKCEKE